MKGTKYTHFSNQLKVKMISPEQFISNKIPTKRLPVSKKNNSSLT
jgi:hypothetical protein